MEEILLSNNLPRRWIQYVRCSVLFRVWPVSYTHLNEDKLGPKLDAIQDCAILYVAAIGGSAAARVVAKNVHPIKVAETQTLEDLLQQLQKVLSGNPPPWIRKALNKGLSLIHI